MNRRLIVSRKKLTVLNKNKNRGKKEKAIKEISYYGRVFNSSSSKNKNNHNNNSKVMRVKITTIKEKEIQKITAKVCEIVSSFTKTNKKTSYRASRKRKMKIQVAKTIFKTSQNFSTFNN